MYRGTVGTAGRILGKWGFKMWATIKMGITLIFLSLCAAYGLSNHNDYYVATFVWLLLYITILVVYYKATENKENYYRLYSIKARESEEYYKTIERNNLIKDIRTNKVLNELQSYEKQCIEKKKKIDRV